MVLNAGNLHHGQYDVRKMTKIGFCFSVTSSYVIELNWILNYDIQFRNTYTIDFNNFVLN